MGQAHFHSRSEEFFQNSIDTGDGYKTKEEKEKEEKKKKEYEEKAKESKPGDNNGKPPKEGRTQQKDGPGDPPTSGEFEFNLSVTFGPQVGFSLLGGLVSANIKVWTFGEISTKDGISGPEFHDDKITSEHSFNLALGNVSYGKGIEHKLEYQGGHNPFRQTDFRWLSTDRGLTTKRDILGNVVERKYDNNIVRLNLLLFSIAFSKDFK